MRITLYDMKKRMFQCLFVCVFILFGVLISCNSAHASKMANINDESSTYTIPVSTKAELGQRLQKLINDYNGTAWTSTGKPCPAHGEGITCYSKCYYGWQCKGFAGYIFNELFCSGNIGSISKKDYGSLEELNGVTLIGTETGLTSVKAKNLLSKGMPGDVIQAKVAGKDYGHTMIITNVTASYVSVFECNYSGRCVVGTRDIKWDDFAIAYREKCSLYHSTRYPANNGISYLAGNIINPAISTKVTSASTSAEFVITSPKGTYTSKNINITGYYVSNKRPAYMMAECPELGKQWNIMQYSRDTSSSMLALFSSAKLLDSATLANKKYLYQFSVNNAFGPYTLKSNTTYHLKFFTDGMCSQITFRTGTLSNQVISQISGQTNNGGAIPVIQQQNLQPVVHIDKPTGSYNGSANIEVSGWVASMVDPSYIIFDYGKQMNLISSKKFAKDVFDAFGGAYTYNYRFSGVIPLSDLKSYTTYHTKTTVGFANQTSTPLYETSFSVGKISSLSNTVSNKTQKIIEAQTKAAPVMVIRAPSGNYQGAGGVAVSGWLASNYKVQYAMGQYLSGMSGGQISLSLTADSGAGSGINTSSYQYIYKFTGSIPSAKLESNRTYQFMTWARTEDGSMPGATASFSTGDVSVIKETLMGFDLPAENGSYAGTMDITGWMVSDSPIAYAQYQVSDRSGKIMTGVSNISYYEDSSVKTAHPGYKYGYRFKANVGLASYASGSSYTAQVWAGTDKGIRTDITRVFKTTALGNLNTKDYVIHLDKPAGFYSGSSNIEVVGWIGSYAPITYAMFQIDKNSSFGGTQNTMSLEEAPDVAAHLNALGYHFTYAKRFRGVVDIGKLSSNTEYVLRVWMGLGSSGVTDSNIIDAIHVFSTQTVTKPTYAVSFNGNGGSGAPAKQTKVYGTDLTLPKTIPERWGYSFEGWSKIRGSSKAQYLPGDKYTDNAAATLYAVWSEAGVIRKTTGKSEYSFEEESKVNGKTGYDYYSFIPVESGVYSFVANSSDGSPAIDTVYASLGKTAQQTSVSSASDDLKTGWDLEANHTYMIALGRKEWNSADSVYQSLTIVQARHLSFDADGGTGEPDDIWYPWDEEIAIPADVPNRTIKITLDYSDNSGETTLKTYDVVFAGWMDNYAEGDDSNQSWQAGDLFADSSDDAEDTLFAWWVLPDAGELPLPVREGYVFAGWYNEHGEKVDEYYQLMRDEVFYASWEKEEILPESITLNKTSLTLSMDEEKNLIATVLPENATENLVIWEAEDDSIASVDASGVIHPVSSGETTIHATTEDGSCRADCNIVVEKCFYTIHYSSGYGVTVPEDQEKPMGEDIMLSDYVPVCTGKIFVGWTAKEKNGEEIIYQSGDTYTEDAALELTAKWINVYEVAFSDNGGADGPGSVSVRSDEELLIPDTEPVWANHTFMGWKKDINDDAPSSLYHGGDVYSVSNDITLYAHWVPDQYQVSFDANGGEGAPEDQIKTADIDLKLSRIQPTRDGFAFKGWAESESATSAKYTAGSAYKENRSLKLYAVWESLHTPVTGIELSVSEKEMELSDKYLIKATIAPADASNVNVEWYSTDESILSVSPEPGNGYICYCTVTALNPGAASVIVRTEDGDYEAQCSITVEDITYTYDFGSYADQIVKHKGESVIMPDYQVEGMEFDYWYYLNGSSKQGRFKAGAACNLNMDLRLYPEWHAITVPVTFDANGGTGSFVVDKAYNQSLDLRISNMSNKPERSGYRLLGWGTEPDAEEIQQFYSGHDETTFYAIWAEEGYDITYHANGGYPQPDEQIRPYKKVVKLTDDIPVRSQYQFAGWSLSAESDEICYRPGDIYSEDTDIDLYAVWKEKEVTGIATEVKSIQLKSGGAYYLNNSDNIQCRTEPEDAFNTKLNYSVQDTHIAEVVALNSSVMITGKQEGTTYLTVTSDDGNHTAYIAIEVSPTYFALTYDASGGEYSPADRMVKQSPYGSATITIPYQRPVKEGYSFLYWSDQEDGKGNIYRTGDAYNIYDDLKLYAVWEEDLKNDVTDIAIDQAGLTLMKGASAQLSASVLPENAAQKELIWSSENEDVAMVSDEGLVQSVGEGNTVITVESAQNSQIYQTCSVEVIASGYTVTYDANGGIGAPEAQTGKIGTPIMLSSTEPERDNYLFTGWAENQSSTDVAYEKGSVFPGDQDIVLYAVWQEHSTHVLTYVEGYEADCTNDGVSSYYVCEQCGKTFKDAEAVEKISKEDLILPKTGHAPESIPGIDPDCEHSGLTEGMQCKNCGSILLEQEQIEAMGHSWNSGTVSKEPTATEEGEMSYTCSVCGEKKKESIPKKKGIINAQTKVSGIKDKTYTGKAVGQTPTIKDGNNTLIKDRDYSLSYKNNTNAGTATVIITGKGNYEGTTSQNFKINAKKITPAVGLSATTYKYDGKAKKPAVTVKDGSKKLAASNYTVTYASGRKNVGTYKVTVKMKGNYTGAKTVSFKINPRATKVTKVTAAKKAFTAKWSKQSKQVTGYQIQYSTNKNFKSGNKPITIKKNTTTSKKISKLKAKKTYYVRVRTYKTVNKKPYYSTWSAAKKVTTK